MAFNGTGTYSLPAGNPVVTGTTISSTTHNTTLSDIATALTDCVTRDGQSPATANLPLGGFKMTGSGTASAATDIPNAGQVQDGSLVWCGVAGGTANALTLTPAPAITAYKAGRQFWFKTGASANTTAATVQISGIATPRAIQKQGSALSAGELAANNWYVLLDDGTTFQLINVVNTGLSVAGWGGTAGGTANALTISPSPAVAAYAAGQVFEFKSSATPNSGATTIAISGLGTIAVQVNGAACVGGEIVASKFYRITLDTASTAQLEKIGAPNPNYQRFTANGTWTKPSGLTGDEMVVVELWGGGGCGGGSLSANGGGGGGGAYAKLETRADYLPLGATETVTVGAGSTTAAAGGTTSFGSWLSAYGGGSGYADGTGIGGGGGGGGLRGAGAVGGAAAGGVGGLGNSASVAAAANADGTGDAGGGGGSTNTNPGGRSFWGGGGGGAGYTSAAGSGGGSLFGGGGGAGKNGAAGGISIFGGNGGMNSAIAAAPGGGGFGSAQAGARGECRVWVIFS